MLMWAASAAKNLFRLRNYEPLAVTGITIWRWLRQFPQKNRVGLVTLLGHLRFISESESIDALCTQNEKILQRLADDGVDIEHVIYVALDSAGSSSGVMLNLLRDHANLERRKAYLVHSSDVTRISELTSKLKRGALIYVDDFCGSGKQFVRNRRHAFAFVTGSFSEFFLTVCACEEGIGKAQEEGVESVTSIVHLTVDRPLHPNSSILQPSEKEALRALCLKMHPEIGLGFGGLATSVVFYRNAPNSTPLVLRGNLGQTPLRGVVPRYDDLPIGPRSFRRN